MEARFIFYDEVTPPPPAPPLLLNTVPRKEAAFPMHHKPHVTLYTKPGCHLCDEAKQEMLKAAIADQYTFEEINIEEDPAAYELYKYEIPVITIDGRKAFKYRLTSEEFMRRIRRGPS